jgi:hypothetical protein
VYDSFRKYCEVEIMDGDNRYKVEERDLGYQVSAAGG